MTQYRVTGMSCAACSARVEKAVSAVPGVTACSVSLLTNAMGVEGDASPDAVIAAVTDAGYGASLKADTPAKTAPDADELADTETPKLVKRLIVSVILLLILMYFSMGHMMWNWPIPAWFQGNHVAMGLVQLLLSGLIMVINQRFFISGFKALLHRAPNMDTLVSMGSAVSFLWSVWVLFMMTDAQLRGDQAAVESDMMQFYFESAAMILTLITVGKTLEARAKGRTTDALKGLMQLAPKTALILDHGTEREVPVSDVRIGTVFLVKPGARIPADGIVQEGFGAVDESALTGESIPAEKTVGSSVSAGTVNSAGFLRCEATRTGEDTTLSQIIRMVGDAAATKAPIAKIADKVSGVFVPAVIAAAVLTAAVWLLLGRSVGFALARGVSVLVISCPCALGLATPVAIMVGSGVGARNGLLFKTAASLEETGRVQTVVLDKTGTVTTGRPQVTDLLPAEGISEETLLREAAAAEQHSEHPLARAVMQAAEARGIVPEPVTAFQAMVGSGISAQCGADRLTGGNAQAVQNAALPEDVLRQADALADQGKTPLFFMKNNRLTGIIAVADVIKPESAEAIARLREMGLSTVMLTGDNEKTAAAIGAQAGVDRVIAGVLPAQKEAVVRELSEQGKVCMVGDGINDAPALTRADVGLAIGAGTDVAIDAADVVLMQSRLTDVPEAIRLSRATLRNIRENLFWALIYNLIGIPLAAGVLVPFGLTLNPMFGAAAMSLSSFCVVMNALRLNLFRFRHPASAAVPAASVHPAEPAENMKGTVNQMAKTTLMIEGMMCEHCEAHVRKALEKLEGVTVLRVSHDDGAAEIENASGLDEAAFRAAVEDAGYTLTGVK